VQVSCRCIFVLHVEGDTVDETICDRDEFYGRHHVTPLELRVHGIKESCVRGWKQKVALFYDVVHAHGPDPGTVQ
jgi:hypothetical protein